MALPQPPLRHSLAALSSWSTAPVSGKACSSDCEGGYVVTLLFSDIFCLCCLACCSYLTLSNIRLHYATRVL